jgi:hypothetical protein
MPSLGSKSGEDESYMGSTGEEDSDSPGANARAATSDALDHKAAGLVVDALKGKELPDMRLKTVNVRAKEMYDAWKESKCTESEQEGDRISSWIRSVKSEERVLSTLSWRMSRSLGSEPNLRTKHWSSAQQMVWHARAR